MNGCVREMKRKVVNTGAKLSLNGEGWSFVTSFFFLNGTVTSRKQGGFAESGKRVL